MKIKLTKNLKKLSNALNSALWTLTPKGIESRSQPDHGSNTASTLEADPQSVECVRTTAKGIKQVPWSEIGAELGKRVVGDADELGSRLQDALNKLPQKPDVTSMSWRYELTLWSMFWLLYLANSPQLQNAGATQLLLDAHHRASYESMIRAGLISTELNAMRVWETDLEERFAKYKKAFDNPPTGPALFTGTIGWEFVQHVYAGQEPDPRVTFIMNEMASIQFQSMDALLQKLENPDGPKGFPSP